MIGHIKGPWEYTRGLPSLDWRWLWWRVRKISWERIFTFPMIWKCEHDKFYYLPHYNKGGEEHSVWSCCWEDILSLNLANLDIFLTTTWLFQSVCLSSQVKVQLVCRKYWYFEPLGCLYSCTSLVSSFHLRKVSQQRAWHTHINSMPQKYLGHKVWGSSSI